ncbi:hypothetical protein evm_006806 [Chilo suppressalis]|nr:hypothetical protein evm_006806 [Chilo suppressalis]
MSEDKRKRSPNWLSSEKELLLSLVEFHFNIIENKKTDRVTIKSKLAQWQIIADQYNSRTSHCFRKAENLKAQWESMKKVARKDAANNRRHMIRTGGGSPLPPKKEDPFLQRILCLISTSAVGLFNPYDSDSIIPAVQDETAIPSLETEDFPEPLAAQYKDILLPPTVVIVGDQISETTVQHNNKDFVTKGLHTRTVGGQTVFTHAEEKALLRAAATCADWVFPLTALDLRMIAKAYLDKQGKNITKNSNNLPGHDWALSVLKRHKDDFSQRVASNIKKARAKVGHDKRVF